MLSYITFYNFKKDAIVNSEITTSNHVIAATVEQTTEKIGDQIAIRESDLNDNLISNESNASNIFTAMEQTGNDIIVFN